MKRVILFSILVCFLGSCVTTVPRKPTVDCKCCEEKVLQIADAAMKYRGWSITDISKYKRAITEEETYFLIEYGFIDDGIVRFGGGGYIKISKETCEIIERRFEQ